MKVDNMEPTDRPKRTHDGEDNGTTNNAKRMKSSDIQVLHQIQSKIHEQDTKISDEIELTRQKYYVSYFKKVLKELPICNNIIDLESIEENRDGFFKTYSIAKTCVSSHLQLKKILAFNSIFDMINSAAFKFIHDKVVTPNVKKILSPQSLSNAFSKYQESLVNEDKDKVLQLHCVAYLIQNEFEKNEPLKVPNPTYNRITQQMTAVSKYITEIIKEIALKPLDTKQN